MRKDAGSERTGKSPQPHARNEIHEQGRELGCAKWIQLRNPATKQQSSFVGGGGCARIACATTPVNGYSLALEDLDFWTKPLSKKRCRSS